MAKEVICNNTYKLNKNDLTTSNISRQNILNNSYALERIEANLPMGGTNCDSEVTFTKAQVAQVLEVDDKLSIDI